MTVLVESKRRRSRRGGMTEIEKVYLEVKEPCDCGGSFEPRFIVEKEVVSK